MKETKRVKRDSDIRVDARIKVSGKARFIEDVEFANMLHGATIRSPIPHGRIASIVNLEKIRNMPGVRAVVTANDIPGENIVPFVKQDYPCLAPDEVKFHGQAVALVAAETVEEARSAARSAEFEYEEYPAVFDAVQAMKPDAVHVGGEDNVHSYFRIRKGDVDKGFREADVIVEGVFNNKHQVHCYLENQGVVAVPESGGGISVYGSMQCPFYVQNALVKVTGIRYSGIKVVQTVTGGGFGGKEDVPSILASHAALLALRTQRPVRIIYDREEDFISMSKRHPARTRVKYGATKEGKITACEAEYIVNGGAFCTLSPIVAWRGVVHISGPYDIPNVKADSYAMATNTVPCGAFRGFGQTQANFANECLMDELAEKLDMDPVELRKRNILKTGSRTSTGQVIGESCGLEETLIKAAEKINFKQHFGRDKGIRKKGMGISTTFYGVGLGAEGEYFAKAGAQVYVKEDGSVIVAIGNVEMGQGSNTVFNRICADTLGCPYESVEVLQPDTTRVPDSGPTVASRSTMVGGRAVLDAARQVCDTFRKVAADKLGVKPFDIEVDAVDSRYRCSRGEMSYFEVVNEAYRRREKVAAQGWYRVEGCTFDQETGQGNPYSVYTYSANACEVEVDTETGQVTVTKFAAAHDIGKAIHMISAEGQIQGGTVQAIGYALHENLVLENGRILNPSLTGYTVPTSLDACDVIPIIVEHPHGEGPFGAKGLGEPPMIGSAAAILNAIYDATGIRFRHTPCLPEDIVKELSKLSI
ncbi:MAG: xanthine dehydrogenase family protein [Elusimicrobia bacterium]|nr:xanthine dehydrogenase family protein [Elusimicrobiota bacterium]